MPPRNYENGSIQPKNRPGKRALHVARLHCITALSHRLREQVVVLCMKAAATSIGPFPWLSASNNTDYARSQ